MILVLVGRGSPLWLPLPPPSSDPPFSLLSASITRPFRAPTSPIQFSFFFLLGCSSSFFGSLPLLPEALDLEDLALLEIFTFGRPSRTVEGYTKTPRETPPLFLDFAVP